MTFILISKNIAFTKSFVCALQQLIVGAYQIHKTLFYIFQQPTLQSSVVDFKQLRFHYQLTWLNNTVGNAISDLLHLYLAQEITYSFKDTSGHYEGQPALWVTNGCTSISDSMTRLSMPVA